MTDSEQTFDPDPRLLTIDQRIHEAFAELMFMFVFDHQQKEQCQIAIKINEKVYLLDFFEFKPK